MVWPHRRAAKARLDDVFENLLKGHAVLFVHREEEERHHDYDHDKRGDADIDRRPEQKENRHTRKCAETEAEQLSFGQVEDDLCFDFRQVLGNGDVGQGETSFRAKTNASSL